VHQIADQIISGALRPGQELDEKKLAEAFNVSRTPVREALRQLAAASLVDWRPHESAIVAKITPSKMVEMFEVMAELEGFCGRLAARAVRQRFSCWKRSVVRAVSRVAVSALAAAMLNTPLAWRSSSFQAM